MERFEVVEMENGKYRVLDTQANKYIRFGYNVPPLYGEEEWNNYYSARVFARSMEVKNPWINS